MISRPFIGRQLRCFARWFAAADGGGDASDAFYAEEATEVLTGLFPERLPTQPVQRTEPEVPPKEKEPPLEPLPPPTMPEIAGERDMDREIRAHNSSLYNLRGQAIIGRVVAVGEKDVLVDLGWKGYQTFFKSELGRSQLYRQRTESGQQGDRVTEFRPGDELRFRIEELGTPHGEIFVSTEKMRADIRKRLVWEELHKAFHDQSLIMGRVLNPTYAGYSIGVGGFVAFCPLHRISPQVARKIGVLQPFMISRIGLEVGRNLTVVDPHVHMVGRAQRY